MLWDLHLKYARYFDPQNGRVVYSDPVGPTCRYIPGFRYYWVIRACRLQGLGFRV